MTATTRMMDGAANGRMRREALRRFLPPIGLAAAPIIALMLLPPTAIDPVILFGAVCVIGASTGSVSFTALISWVALAAWVGPLLLG
jgi:hypothetical protein